MKTRISLSVALVSAALLTGCGSGLTQVEPRVLAPHELTLRYDNEFQIWSPQGQVATSVRYRGLSEFVGCVPDAQRHALAAESAGDAAVGMTTTGIGLALLGLGGLGGLAFQDDPQVMAGFFIAGLSSEVIGLVLTAVGRSMKVDANGHAVDAVNYYNDAVGSLGGRCGPNGAEMPQYQPPPPPPPAEEPAAEPAAAVPPPPPPIRPVPVQANGGAGVTITVKPTLTPP